MPAVMIQGTGSNVGKSMLVAGLCRAARARGLNVAPFKPQNMSNNAAVTADGAEIGRAQALQALACGLEATRHMNPVLIKPESDTGAQVIVQGTQSFAITAADYQVRRANLMDAVLDSFARLSADHDLIVVEGAGSPAEINLRNGDIANMGFAEAAKVPVILAGDIDKGAVNAQIVGTQAVLPPEDAAWIRGFLVNKFRGDPRLFDAGYDAIAARTGWQGFGVVPWFNKAHLLPAEDALDLTSGRCDGQVRVACLCLSRIANFDDLDPLSAESDVDLIMVRPGQAIPADADLVVLPGTKSTRGDLAFMRAQGWDIDLLAHHRRGGHVLGLCGGYQMLGRRVIDDAGTDGEPGETAGLGLLDIETRMGREKMRSQTVAVHCATGAAINGYEIHIGQSGGPSCETPFARIDGRAEGAMSLDGRVMGTYLHGLFKAEAFRAAFLQDLGGTADVFSHDLLVDKVLDDLAQHLEQHLDIDAILAVAE